MPNPDYPKELKTWGDHVRKKRLDLGLMQKDAAIIIDVDKSTLWNWEHNIEPEIKYMPRIIQFLGYVPYINMPVTLGEKIVFVRQLHGISQEKLARSIEIDPTTLSKWERDKRKPSKKYFMKLNEKLYLQSK